LVKGADTRFDDPTRCGFFTGGGGNESFLPGNEDAADAEELGRSSKTIQTSHMTANCGNTARFKLNSMV
jgi:hypothetical protein